MTKPTKRKCHGSCYPPCNQHTKRKKLEPERFRLHLGGNYHICRYVFSACACERDEDGHADEDVIVEVVKRIDRRAR